MHGSSFDRRTGWYTDHTATFRKYPLLKTLYFESLYAFLRLRNFGTRVVSSIWKRSGLQALYYVKDYHHARSVTVDTEIATIRFLRSHTTIPLPRVYFQFRWLFDRYIIMERLPGVSLKSVILTLSEREAEDLQIQLRMIMDELRSVKHPLTAVSTDSIASVIGGPIFCHRLHRYEELSGPFRDQDHMNTQLRNAHPLESLPESVQTLHRTTYPIVLTHNDFAARNVLVDQDETGKWRVTALLDFECTGWLPSYWEYTQSRNVAAGGSPESERIWNNVWLPRVLQPYEVEADADAELGGLVGYPKRHIGLPHFVAA